MVRPPYIQEMRVRNLGGNRGRSVFVKTNKMAKLKYSRIEYKTHFVSGANSYRFRHQGSFIREFMNNKVL